jgi:CBS-domain-containing membrane protein
MLTDRDITVRAVAATRDPLTTQGRDVMTPGVVYGFEDQAVADAARLMAQDQMWRLSVLTRRKQLIGIVALSDLAVHAGTQMVATEVLEQISEPGTSGQK